MSSILDAIESALDRVDMLAYRVESLHVAVCLELLRVPGSENAQAALEQLRLADEAHTVAVGEAVRLLEVARTRRKG